MGLLKIVHDADGGAAMVCVEGDVDSSSVSELIEALDSGLAAGAEAPRRVLVVGLADVTYFGSAGLNTVLNCYERGLAMDVAVRVVAAHPEVLRPIQVTKLDDVLRPFASIEDALAADAGPP